MKNDVQGLHGVKPCLLNEVARQEPNKRLPLQEKQACFSKRRGEGTMNKGRLSVLVCMVAIIALGFGFVACGGGGSDCDCDPKAHLGIGETCDCGGSGCDCTEQVDNLDGILIRKEAGITVQQMNSAVINIQDAYDENLLSSQKEIFKTKDVEIQIITGGSISLQGRIIKIGYEATKVAIGDSDIFFDVIY